MLEEDGVLHRPDGFAQANVVVNRRLVQAAVELLELRAVDRVLELYAGNGNFLPSSANTSILIKLPVATSDGQCKKGGWQFVTDDLGNLFKNQGDCVSYVATKGKNKGAGGTP